MEFDIPEVESKTGLDLCDGNTVIYLNALRLFVSGIPADLEKMKGVSQDTLADYTVAAHSVKSMSNYIGAEESRKTAKELELMSKSGDLAGVLARNEAFLKYVHGIVDNVRNWLEKNDQLIVSI